MNFKEILCSELKNYRTVIIYGYKDIGTCLLEYIIEFETSIKIANYSGRVKYFAHSSSETTSARLEKKGISIKSIYDLTDFAEDALVIIATQEKHHSKITEILDELQFKNRLYITHEAYCILREAVENHRNIIDNRVMQYHANHQMKLNRLRDKVRSGKKVKVFFMVHDSAVFGYASVYKTMEDEEIFEPYIYVISRRDVSYKQFYEDVLKDVEFFQKKGYRVINGYDEMNNPKDLHEFAPDILFYDLPKLYGSAGSFYYRLDQLNWEYLTCYAPYGLLMVDSFYYHYHTRCIRETWKFFIDTSASFKRVLADSEFNGFNTVFSGYPKFDDYYEESADLPEKLQNGNPTVIYAPHHSLGVSNNFATFDLYKDIFLDMVKKNPDINFVFKPHPLLPFQIKAHSKRLNFTYEDYMAYMNEWNSEPNGICITQGDYIKIFMHSKCMITDCGSFIGEYLPTLNPCIYIFNPRKQGQNDVYTSLAQKILDTYYVCHTKEELAYYIEEIIMKEKDTKKEERKAILNSEFSNLGHVGKYICEYIKKQVM